MKRDIVILCIGSSQIVGDSVGPMVGDYLVSMGVKAYVYGTMAHPVNAKNLETYVSMVNSYHRNSIMVVVDATVGDKRDVGEVKINSDGVKPGGAINRNLPRIGDIGVLGVVAKRSKSLITALMNVDIKVVESIALKIGRLLMSTFGQSAKNAF